MVLIKEDVALCELVHFMNLVIFLSYSEIISSLSLPTPAQFGDTRATWVFLIVK